MVGSEWDPTGGCDGWWIKDDKVLDAQQEVLAPQMEEEAEKRQKFGDISDRICQWNKGMTDLLIELAVCASLPNIL